MARSKLGGTRSRLHGAVGDVVFQTEKVGNTYSQVVMARARERENPNTDGQVIARMTMGQIQRMFHILPDIIREAFVSIDKGAMSFQYFAKLNYPLLRADRLNHWTTGAQFDWQPKRRLSAPGGPWFLTEGVLPTLASDLMGFSYSWNNGLYLEWLNVDTYDTVGSLLKRMNLKKGDSLILLFYRKNLPEMVPFIYQFKFHVNEELDDEMFVGLTMENEILVPEDDALGWAGYLMARRRFALQWEDPNPREDYVVSCGASIIRREVAGKILFSSSQFQWLEHDGLSYYTKVPAATAFAQWKSTE